MKYQPLLPLVAATILLHTRTAQSWCGPNSNPNRKRSVLQLQDQQQETSTINVRMESSNEVVGPSCTTIRTKDVLSLESIRSSLIRQEETIVFALIERSQYRHNPIVYQHGGFGDLGTPLGSTQPPPVAQEPDEVDGKSNLLSFCEYMLIGTEVLHWGVRRYTSPEENAFFPNRLPKETNTNSKLLPPLDYPPLLDETLDINFNSILLKRFVSEIIPAITSEGDDEQHGSSVINDMNVLQALSKRVHYGKFVAESKYRSDPEAYQKLVSEDDVDGVMKLLTNEKVEQKVLRRARLKAATYGREPLLSDFPPIAGDEKGSTTSIVAAAAAAAVVAAVEAIGEENLSSKDSSNSSTKVDPAIIESVYRDIIIPLTKVIEVAYLFRRCGKEPPKDRKSVV